jgi:cell division transport system ATP-binding protein
MHEPIVSYFDVTLFEDGREILTNIDLEVYPGDMLYITGTIGSGKSTLLKSMYGEKKIHSGDARVAGFDLTQVKRKDIPFLRRKLGLVFQNYQLLNDRNTEKNIRFALECTGEKNRKYIKQRTLELSEQAGIEHLLHKMPYELSGGEQQLVSIVRALMNEPELIITDEPTANLDRESSRRIMQFLQRLSENGTAVIIATHDDTLIAEFPSETLRIENKRLEKFATTL